MRSKPLLLALSLALLLGLCLRPASSPEAPPPGPAVQCGLQRLTVCWVAPKEQAEI